MNHFITHPKLTQHWRSAILQYKFLKKGEESGGLALWPADPGLAEGTVDDRREGGAHFMTSQDVRCV